MPQLSGPSFDLEHQYKGVVAGVDEVGRGPWAGPVMAGAVIFRTVELDFIGDIQDSKKLSAKNRDRLFDALIKAAEDRHLFFGLGQSTVEEIDTLNIAQATFLAMQRAVQHLPFLPDHILVDGLKAPKFSRSATPVVKGDQISTSIAAASILAKVTRDRLMKRLHGDYPFYAWDRNMGYGTRAHQEGLGQHGITPHHRRSYAPIARLLDASTAA